MFAGDYIDHAQYVAFWHELQTIANIRVVVAVFLGCRSNVKRTKHTLVLSSLSTIRLSERHGKTFCFKVGPSLRVAERGVNMEGSLGRGH